MNKPTIICYMMTSLDGRIDCAMTEQLPGVEDYYTLLEELSLLSTISGRVTAETEMAEPGKFQPQTGEAIAQETVSKKTSSTIGYDIVVDTKGTLLWKDASEYDKPLLIITSEMASREYLTYLDERNLSYIATGQSEINLTRAVALLKDVFDIERLGIVGGPTINTAFLDARLLDEVILLVGAGIDGRATFPPVFNSTDEARTLTPLRLLEARVTPAEAVLLRYAVR